MTATQWPTGLLILGTLFHAIYLLSIFDIYFKSPVVHDIPAVDVMHESYPPPAKRLVIFIADGCRADTFFDATDRYAVFAHSRLREANLTSLIHSQFQDDEPTRAPFLRHVIKHVGSWGVSHTGVPTESRPGHVAMFAGMYEDVSAVTRGWQENPVDFDSIFNQSTHAWLYGSPDIVPMFAKNVEHVHEKHYSSADEDFAKDATVLDTWVYHKVQALLDDAKTNRTLFNQLQANQVVFFLHFLGIDSNGHAHRPHSREYISNVALVDRLVEGIHTMLEAFFQDKATAYIFSADHGMSHQGSHGDGAPENTRTPLVVWGAGVQPPTLKSALDTHAAHGSGFAMDVPSHSHDQVFDQLKAHTVPEADALRLWNLSSFVRKDVLQADIAPLAAALLGLPYPRNSVGVLPFSYMEQGLYRARAVVFNAKSLFVHASIRQQLKQNATWPIFFRGFPRLDRCLGQFATIDRAFGAKAYGDIEAISQRIIGDALAGLRHFQRYDWLLLMAIITLGYLGWMLVLYVAVARWPFTESSLVQHDDGSWDMGSVTSVCVGSGLLFAYNHQATSMYYLYLVFPLVFWRFLLRERQFLLAQRGVGWSVVGLVLVSIELIVWGYSNRSVFSALCLVIGIYPNMNSIYDRTTARLWMGSCVILSLFPLAPLDYGDDLNLVVAGGCIGLAVGTFVWCAVTPTPIHGSSLVFIGLSIGSVLGTMAALSSNMHLAPWIYLNWFAAFGPLLSLFWVSYPPSLTLRLVQIMMAVAPVFVLLSISYEVFFYAAFCTTLLLWIRLETSTVAPRHTRQHSTGLAVTPEDIRLALWYLIFFKLSFFATGNIASMSSFEISSTFRFVTVFNPFVMGALLVLKILLPMVIVTCAFHVLLTLKGHHPNRYVFLPNIYIFIYLLFSIS
ncbi:hypothetical protein, variant [Aphanomyces astaci]|uniref:GPI ethanolamine phosphate transferase 1 n=1 Tax=Aphanomyces astaci TaxID=112090 RepID=W4FJ49_APHAT|nr:hypothetical protein, variant [Aphanomyces astaci]ETV66861.1 hypothetical protein, variant [Aphanomyces astaci]|eukprot:XP_009843664.1 hypothetical protein, variant [Aphanomyces astaci]